LINKAPKGPLPLGVLFDRGGIGRNKTFNIALITALAVLFFWTRNGLAKWRGYGWHIAQADGLGIGSGWFWPIYRIHFK